MGNIKILDENVSNIIAAGEVVENPASMIKEMIENSLDAGASIINIEVADSGVNVKVSDNGCGMDKNDTLLSIERHATSKIAKKEDIFNLSTYGFRGEALSSIASVSKLTINTRTADSPIGYQVASYGGVVRKLEEISKNPGTEIEVRDLFYNTPARKKFLRKESTEYNKIRDIVLREALANENVAFSLTLDGKESIKTSGKGMENTILELFGKSALKNLKKFKYGYLGTVDLLRSTKDYIFTYINKRSVKSVVIEKAVLDGYYTKLMKGKYPFVIVDMSINPKEIDVNVHPSKKIVKFSDERAIYREVKAAVDEFFAEEEKDIWSPDLDLLKQNIKVEADEKPEDIFKDEKIKGENKSFFSFETNDNMNTQTKELNHNIADENIIQEKETIQYRVSQDVYKQNEVMEEPKQKYNASQEEKELVEEEMPDVPIGKIHGQLFNMYILIEKDDNLEMYDQHIVHERILYEELKEKFYNKKMEVQNLLVPQAIELTESDKTIANENKGVLKEFGFEIDDFSKNEIVIRTVPAFDFRDNIKNVFIELLDDIKKEKEIKDIREKIIISMSCKGAIKAGEQLNFFEIEKLMKHFYKFNKMTCPHGRPIVIRISKNELDKMFGRKK